MSTLKNWTNKVATFQQFEKPVLLIPAIMFCHGNKETFLNFLLGRYADGILKLYKVVYKRRSKKLHFWDLQMNFCLKLLKIYIYISPVTSSCLPGQSNVRMDWNTNKIHSVSEFFLELEQICS